MILNINTDASVKFTNQLEKMHRSALPSAVRETLSKTALDVKKNTMPAKAKSAFVNRSPNFFRGNSRVEFARGYNLKNMQATVGFVSQNLQGDNNFAVKDLEQQEHGGEIKKKSFIPTEQARKAGKGTLVKPANRLSQLRNLADTKNVSGRNEGERLIKSAIHVGKGGLILANLKGRQFLWRVNSFEGKKPVLSVLYSFKKGRSVRVTATNFMREASNLSAAKMETIYASEAKRQIERLSQ